MKRIILGAIMLLSIPALANSVAIADFAVERYADYTWSKPSITTPEVVTGNPAIDQILHESLVAVCLNGTAINMDKTCPDVGANRIYSADTANILRDSAFILLGIGGIVLIVSSKRKQKIKG